MGSLGGIGGNLAAQLRTNPEARAVTRTGAQAYLDPSAALESADEDILVSTVLDVGEGSEAAPDREAAVPRAPESQAGAYAPAPAPLQTVAAPAVESASVGSGTGVSRRGMASVGSAPDAPPSAVRRAARWILIGLLVVAGIEALLLLTAAPVR